MCFFSVIYNKCYELANTLYVSIGSPNPSPFLRGIWDDFLACIAEIPNPFTWLERTVTPEGESDSTTTQTVDRLGNSIISPQNIRETKWDKCSKLAPGERDIAEEYERMFSNLSNKSRRSLTELLILAEARQNELKSQMLSQLIGSIKLILNPITEIDNKIVDERRILSDGNCLFNAVLGGLHDHNLHTDSTHTELRVLAITHLKALLEENPEEITSFLAGAIIGYQEAKRESLEMHRLFLENYLIDCPDEEKKEVELGLRENQREMRELEELSAEQYLQLAEREGFFCSETELRALGEVLENITIHVHRRDSDSVTSYGTGDRGIHILYNGLDHYDRYLVADR